MSTIDGTDDPETLDGTTGDDIINGKGGIDTLNGLEGSDILDGGEGADTLNGGTGDDFYVVDNVGDIVNEADGEGTDAVFSKNSYVLAAGAWVEYLYAADNTATTALDLTGNDHTIALLGNNGDNVLTGGAGNETFLGFAGEDTLNGSGGIDLLFGMDGNDALNGGAGNDYLDGGAGLDTLAGGLDDDTYVITDSRALVVEAAGEGYDTVYATTTYVLAAAASVELLSTIDNSATNAIDLTGGNLGGAILGNNGINTLNGGTGGDILLGFAGIDTLNGGGGNDMLFGMDGIDWLSGGEGDDFLDGGAGPDVMKGNAGADIYIVDDSGDVAQDFGPDSQDLVYASVDYRIVSDGVEALLAVDRTATSDLRLWGNASDNAVYGNNGDNFLDGLGGVDRLIGYGGADIFNFSYVGDIDPADFPGLPPDIDVIVDFTPGEDKIRLDTTKFEGVLGVTGFFEMGSVATSTATRILYDPATGLLYCDPDGMGGSRSPRAFAQLTPGLVLHESDFIAEANHAPEANPDSYAIAFNGQTGRTIDITMQQNDFDGDGFQAWVTKVGLVGEPMITVGTGLTGISLQGTYGILSGGGKSNQFTYTLSASDPDVIALAPGQTVTEVFTYEVTDGVRPGFLQTTAFALYDESTITITITRADSGAVMSMISAGEADKPASHDIAAPAQPDAAPQDDSLAAIRPETVFDDGGSRHELRLAIAANLDQPEMLGHHAQLA